MCISVFGIWSGTHGHYAHFNHSQDIVFCFFWGSNGTVHGPSNLVKRRFLGKFGPHSTIHTFKNYFVIVFSVISFQFSANKRYPNKPLHVPLSITLACIVGPALFPISHYSPPSAQWTQRWFSPNKYKQWKNGGEKKIVLDNLYIYIYIYICVCVLCQNSEKIQLEYVIGVQFLPCILNYYFLILESNVEPHDNYPLRWIIEYKSKESRINES